MSIIADRAAELETALRTVEGVRYCRDPASAVDPPATVLGPPALTWDSPCAPPTSATWPVYVVVALSERANERLWDLVPRVSAALDDVTDAAVRRADPSVFSAGGQDLPSYEITVEVEL